MNRIKGKIKLNNVADLEQLPEILELLTKPKHTPKEWELLVRYFKDIEVCETPSMN